MTFAFSFCHRAGTSLSNLSANLFYLFTSSFFNKQILHTNKIPDHDFFSHPTLRDAILQRWM